jgi:ElaB/YqjD/DUF883 family membrane-anchored ribosome-binding protein
MASEPIPEPLTNQDIRDERKPEFPRSGMRLGDNAEAANAVVAIDPNRELPPGKSSPRLNRAAEGLGGTLGKVVNRARDLSNQGEQTASSVKHAAKTKLRDVKQEASETLDAVQQSASAGFRQAIEQVSESAENVRFTANHGARRARERAQHIVREYPLQVIAASAAFGLVVGVLLRIWRSSRYD